MAKKFEFTGVKAVVDEFNKIQKTHEITNEALMEVGLHVKRTATTLCPVKTGHLRRSITISQETDGVEIGTNVHYAPQVHERYPFFDYALAGALNRLLTIINTHIK